MGEKSLSAKLMSTIVALQTASVLLNLIESSYGGATLFQWIQMGILAVTAVCLFILGSEHLFFRLSGLCWGAVSVVTLVSFLLSTPEMLTDPSKAWIFTMLYWVGLVINYPASILEYLAYGKAAISLRKKWLVLLVVNLAWVLVGYGASALALQMYTSQTWSHQTVYTVAQIIQGVNLAIRLLYLWFLFQTYQIISKRDAR